MFNMLFNTQRNYLKIAFPITVLLLCISFYYNITIQRPPTGADLCTLWKDRLHVNKNNYKNESKKWWEWACLIEKEWDNGKEYNCKDVRAMGNYYICYDEPYRPTQPCLVYSFGIDNDFRFDDAMADAGCEVYAFDPSMGVEDHKHSERVQFLNLGIATEDRDDFMPLIDSYTSKSKSTWKIRTLASIKKMLGHENRVLDVLKMDVETYEWAIVEQLIKDGTLKSVRQLTLEWHIFANEPIRSEFHRMFGTYMDLKKMGFRQFYMNAGSRYRTKYYFNMQTDNSLVNTMLSKN